MIDPRPQTRVLAAGTCCPRFLGQVQVNIIFFLFFCCSQMWKLFKNVGINTTWENVPLAVGL